MSNLAELILLRAREWIGTPYVHQAAVKGAGCDCLGLLRGVWREVYGQEPEAAPAYTADWSEASRQERLWEAASRHLKSKSLSDEAQGDVILFRMRDAGVAKHLGIASKIGPSASFIHAYSEHGVVENPLSAPWWRRVVARFEFPERG